MKKGETLYDKYPAQFAADVLDASRVMQYRKDLKLAKELLNMCNLVVPVIERIIQVTEADLKVRNRRR